jgi:hypothetical protein
LGQQAHAKFITFEFFSSAIFSKFFVFIIGATFLIYPKFANSNDFDTNLLNIFYFEHATLTADECEKRGFPSRSIYAKWLNENNSIHQIIIKEVLNDFAKKGLTEKQSELMLSDIRLTYQKMSIKEISTSNKICGAFREYISGFDTLDRSLFKGIR